MSEWQGPEKKKRYFTDGPEDYGACPHGAQICPLCSAPEQPERIGGRSREEWLALNAQLLVTGRGSQVSVADVAALVSAAFQREALVKALEEIRDIADSPTGGDWDEIEQARSIARAALDSVRK